MDVHLSLGQTVSVCVFEVSSFLFVFFVTPNLSNCLCYCRRLLPSSFFSKSCWLTLDRANCQTLVAMVVVPLFRWHFFLFLFVSSNQFNYSFLLHVSCFCSALIKLVKGYQFFFACLPTQATLSVSLFVNFQSMRAPLLQNCQLWRDKFFVPFLLPFLHWYCCVVLFCRNEGECWLWWMLLLMLLMLSPMNFLWFDLITVKDRRRHIRSAFL